MHVDVAGLPVHLDPSAGDGAVGLLVRGEQGLLDRVHQHGERDVLLALHQPKHGDVDVHLGLLPFISLDFALRPIQLDLHQRLAHRGEVQLADRSIDLELHGLAHRSQRSAR